MTPAKDFEHHLITEYDQSKETLISKFSGPLSKQEAKESINATLLLASAKQATIILKELPSEYLAGMYIESDYLSHKVPAYVGFDLSHVSKTHLNKITKETIGQIGNFNEGIANELKLRYGTLIADNELVNSIEKYGWTANTDKRLLKMGFDKETINLIKQQTTANKMVALLEQQGIRGGMHPTEVARLLRPHIRAIFGPEGVTIDNVGKLRKELVVTGDGKYRWIKRKITRPYTSTVQNYANSISRSNMLRAHNLGRVETLRQSGFVEKYRFISSLTANSCDICVGMHSLIVDPGDIMPPVHPRCGCYLAAVWKKETGLFNHSEEYYSNQRDTALFKRYKLKEYNKTHETKLTNVNFLPPIGGIPKGDEMRTIREAILG